MTMDSQVGSFGAPRQIGLFGQTFIGMQVLAAGALLVGIGVLLAGLVPAFFGAETFVVQSGSMEPAVHTGSVAVVKGTRLTALKPGDIVTYRMPENPDNVVTHRL